MLAQQMRSGAPSEIPAAAAQAARELIDLLAAVYGQTLLSLTVHGDALDAGDPHGGMESVMVLSRIELSGLQKLALEGKRLGRLGIAAPLAMTPEDISSSLDSFPLELLEIQQRHVTLNGKDYFADLKIEPADLRLQCEREFKRILMRLRQAVLTAAGRSEILEGLSHDLKRHLLRTLRGFLWLGGQKEFVPASAVASACGRKIGDPLTGVSVVLNSGGRISDSLDALYKDVNLLAERADRA